MYGMRTGFDNDMYIEMQAARIRERIAQFGGKLYLEFGGKLFDDYHASRVLPGFEPDSKVRMLMSLADDAEVIIAINANHIEGNKHRSDIGIAYSEDVLRLMDVYREMGLLVGGVVITHFTGQPHAEAYQRRLEAMNIKCYRQIFRLFFLQDFKHDIQETINRICMESLCICQIRKSIKCPVQNTVSVNQYNFSSHKNSPIWLFF